MTGATGIDHIFLTRFNVPSPGAEQFVRARAGWLEQRTVLFEKYCLPSVKHQTAVNLHWIIYFDPDSPVWLKERVAQWSAGGHFRAIYRSSVSTAELRSDVRSMVKQHSGRLLTTNLDNDDGLARNFAARLQAAAVHAQPTALYLSDGIIVSGGRAYRRVDKDNAFCSVIETWEDPVTCWADAHNMLKHTMATESVSGEPAWLQVIHGGNVSNRVHGRVVSPEPYQHLFPGMLDAVSRPGVLLRMRENIVVAPARAALHLLRTTARKAIVRLLGRTGLDRLKNAIASWRNIGRQST